MSDFTYTIKHILGGLFSPFVLGVLLFFITVIWLLIFGDSWKIRISLIFLCVSLLLCANDWLPERMVNFLENQYPVVKTADPDVHWVVVLGGGSVADPEVPPQFRLTGSSLRRLLEGVRLTQQLPQAKLILSGGCVSRDLQQSEAVHLAAVAHWFNIPQRQIILEPDSLSTIDEVNNIKPIIKQEPFYLVTSASHMPRAMEQCKKHGLHPIAAPADKTYWPNVFHRKVFTLRPVNLVHVQRAWHEILGQFWSKLKGDA